MQALLDTLLASALAEQQQLQAAQQQLEADRAAFEQETVAVQVGALAWCI
jgi:GAF domain-containing protein